MFAICVLLVSQFLHLLCFSSSSSSSNRTQASAVAIAAYGSALVRQGHLSAGQLTSFTMYSGLAGMGLAGLLRAGATDWQSPAWRLLRLAQAADKATAGETTASTSATTTTTARSQGHLQFRGVHFAYPTHASGGSKGPEVLSGVDLEVRLLAHVVCTRVD